MPLFGHNLPNERRAFPKRRDCVESTQRLYRGLDESRAATYEFVASLIMVRPVTQDVLCRHCIRAFGLLDLKVT